MSNYPHLAEYIEQLGTPETKAAAIVERNNWVETAMQFSSGESYYRDLLDQIAANFGEDAFLADDGSNVGSVVRARLPELVASRLSSPVTNEGAGR